MPPLGYFLSTRRISMQTRQMTATASQLMVEQLVASGVKYVFNNSGSREALFFDSLHARSDIHGILGLHEGAVTAMAGGYTQGSLTPGVMVVHLGAGLAQAMGQLINIWTGSLPVVVITFAGDTGSFAGKISLDVSHNAGPTAIAAPMMKANWTVIEPEGLPAAVERALRVAMTPPVGPVHLAVYDRLLGHQEHTANIIDGGIPEFRAGYPSNSDVEAVASALRDAKRPMMYVGDGVWKSGAIGEVTALAERFGVPVVGDPRAVPIKHPLHAGGRRLEQAADIDPDLIIMDVIMPRKDGIDACREIMDKLPDTRVLMLTASNDNTALIQSIAAGATGYLQKYSGKQKLLSAIREVADGELRVPADAARLLFAGLSGTGQLDDDQMRGLSEKQVEILTFFSQGMTYAQIAEVTGRTKLTVRNNIYQIQDKLGIDTKQGIVVWAVRNGLLDDFTIDA